MTLRWQAAPALAAVCALVLGCGSDDSQSVEETPPAFDAARAMADAQEQVELGPRPAGSRANRRLTRILAGELRAAGVEDVRIQRPHRNVVGTIPGEGAGSVVVGAHHDTKELDARFVGANDGASGVAVVLELARTLRPAADGPSIEIALFDAEEARGDRPFTEDGTRGSRQYLRHAAAGGRQGSPALSEIEAMVLFDMVGDCDLQVPREGNSDSGLYGLFAEAAPDVFTGEATSPILDDHIPFREAGIPVLDVIDFEFGPGSRPGAYWHTAEDTIDKVCAESLGAVGEAGLEVIPQIR